MEIKLVTRGKERYLDVRGAVALVKITDRVPSGIARKAENGRVVAPNRIGRFQRVADKLIGGINDEAGRLFFNGEAPSVRERMRGWGWRVKPVIFG